MRTRRIDARGHLRRRLLQPASIQVPQEHTERLSPNSPAIRQQLIQPILGLFPLVLLPLGEDLPENLASRRQDAAVNADADALDHDIGIGAVEIGVQQQALEVAA